MPTWKSPPKDLLGNALAEIWSGLDSEVAEMPSFDEVTGLPMQSLAEHALEAVTAYLTRGESPSPLDPNAWVQVYCLGFVVGMKYGESRESPSGDKP